MRLLIWRDKMGATKNGAGSKPDSLPAAGQDAAGTPPEPKPTGQPSGAEPGSFTTVNRDTLPPELQKVYDHMNRDYTQKTQAISSERSQFSAQRDAARVGTLVMQNPELRAIVRRVADGGSVADAVPQSPTAPQPQPEPDPETDPLGYIDNRIETKMRSVLGEFMPKINEGLSQVRGYVQRSQADSEFERLCAKYPLARDIGSDAVNMVRGQYRTAGGAPISMEDAYAFMAKEEPAILGSGAPQVTIPADPPVESGGSGGEGGGGGKPPEQPRGIRALQAKVKTILSAGEMTEDGFDRRLARRVVEEITTER